MSVVTVLLFDMECMIMALPGSLLGELRWPVCSHKRDACSDGSDGCAAALQTQHPASESGGVCQHITPPCGVTLSYVPALLLLPAEAGGDVFVLPMIVGSISQLSDVEASAHGKSVRWVGVNCPLHCCLHCI